MKVRFSSFIGNREVSKVEGGYTTRVDFELPHHVMLCNLTNEDLHNLIQQCTDILYGREGTKRTVFLGSVRCIEEVSNRLEENRYE